MKTFMTKAYVKVDNFFENKVKGYLKNERGSQSLEWIGIAAIIVILTGVISTAMGNTKFGETFVSKLEGFLGKIGGE
ncbi:MAG TPA: hypothetical protein VNM45_08335 [Bacillus sp. (in: firmicutes)]|nr:hypothetical protein [Bacillus sp. (in: firmicutes)]